MISPSIYSIAQNIHQDPYNKSRVTENTHTNVLLQVNMGTVYHIFIIIIVELPN